VSGPTPDEVARRLAEAEATIEALLSGQIDAVVDPTTQTPVMLSQAQAALRESEARYRRIVETTSDGILTVDRGAVVTFVNGPCADMLGYAPHEILGRSMFDFVPDATRARAERRFENSGKGDSEESEVMCLRKDGSVLWALLKSSPIRDADGAYIGTLAMMSDRTRHRAAEEAVRKSEEQYRQIVENTTDGIIKIDARVQIVFVNRRFAEMLGYEPHELAGVNAFTLMSLASRVATTEAFRERRAGSRAAVDSAFRHRDGTEVAVCITGTPLYEAGGRYVGSLGVVRDVTEEKKLQSQLMVSDRMASVGTLAAGVAHEINNPLAAVIANLDYIVDRLGETRGSADAWLREEVKAPLDEAREAAQRVRFIVRDLKIFSRSPGEEPAGTADVHAIMESSLRMAWNEIRHRAQLVKDYAVLPGVQANEGRLGQVFLNLLVNAAQALPEGQAERNTIHVRTRQDGDRVIIEVSDTGPGIPAAIIGRIFDAFFTTKEVGMGSGLGLAICQRIVTDMGGALTVSSEVGVGTMFRVSLRIARAEDAPVVVTDEPATVAGRRGRILVVDDEEMLVRTIKRVLGKEHDVVGLVRAREALDLCEAGERFDLILCDLMMPEMTGMDLHRELSRVVPEQADRMIFLTGGAFTIPARTFLSEPPKEHLEKPFDPGNLRAIVHRYLRTA